MFRSSRMFIVVLVIMALLLSGCVEPITKITYTYNSDLTVVEYVDFDVKVQGVPVLWIGEQAILCDLTGDHAHCKVGLPVDEMKLMRVEIVER